MSDHFKPRDETDLVEVITWAADRQTPLELVGSGSKRGVGRPLQTAHTLDLSGLTGITLYEPDELVLTAKAGTPLAEIEAALAAHDQELAFEPMDFGPLLGSEAGATLGGLVAGNVSGPRRIKAGAARDHVLGIHAVSGRGEAFKSGGRVVKNVTGYDLSKGLSGSWGTLAAFSEITVKVLPKAETEVTILIAGLSDAEAAAAMNAAMGSSADVSGAAHLPANITERSGVSAVSADKQAVTALRIEGIGPSVAYRARHLMAQLDAPGTLSRLEADDSRALWREIRDVRAFAGEDNRPVWKISVAPDVGHHVVGALAGSMDGDAFYDWSGGLVWLAIEAGDDGGAAAIRAAIADEGGGHATLIRGAPDLRARIPVFQPQATPLAALTRRLKESFDPRGILNPGRMYAGGVTGNHADQFHASAA